MKDKLTTAENALEEAKGKINKYIQKGREARKARKEAEVLVNEARRNASRIINDALLKAEKAQNHADQLKRNTNVLKRRLRQIIENQLEVIEEMDKVDFNEVDNKY